MLGACVAMEESGVAHEILERKSAGRIPMVRPRHKRENDMEIGYLHMIGSCNSLTWLRTWTCLLPCNVYISVFHKMRGILLLVQETKFSQEGLCCVQLFS